jgi:peptide deformylase
MDMAIQKLVLWPNPELKEPSTDVEPHWVKSDEFKELIRDMTETLLHYGGIGLSAIQIGVPDRLFVMRTKQSDKWVVAPFINPIIRGTDGELAEVDEGCLSMPGIIEKVKRYPNVLLSAIDLETGERKSWDLEGIEAQCAQHEMEHMDGKTLGDNWGPVKCDIVRRKIRKNMKLFNRYVQYQKENA